MEQAHRRNIIRAQSGGGKSAELDDMLGRSAHFACQCAFSLFGAGESAKN